MASGMQSKYFAIFPIKIPIKMFLGNTEIFDSLPSSRIQKESLFPP